MGVLLDSDVTAGIQSEQIFGFEFAGQNNANRLEIDPTGCNNDCDTNFGYSPYSKTKFMFSGPIIGFGTYSV